MKLTIMKTIGVCAPLTISIDQANDTKCLKPIGICSSALYKSILDLTLLYVSPRELGQVNVYNYPITRFNIGLGLRYRLLGRTTWPKAIAAIGERWIPAGL